LRLLHVAQGNAEKSRIIMVGDTLKKAGASEQGLVTIKDLGDTEYGTSNVVMFHSSIHKGQF
jgi:hypothetical protein